jgi:hypothetical protein
MIIRQSTIKQWASCPLKVYWQDQGIPRLQSGSATFGSIIHDCVLHLEVTQDLEGTIERFKNFWRNPEQLDPTYPVDYYVRGTNWRKFLERGERIIRDWWSLIQWETDEVLGREYTFNVPIGNGHTLHGTVDKLTVRWSPKDDSWVLLISDYKTNAKVPTYAYLEEDLQFSAYSYASLQPEFWEPMFPGDPARGLALYEKYKNFPRRGEWVHLNDCKRMDAGLREERHINRLIMAVNAMADSIDLGIYVPTISGDSCRYCDFRTQCGLPEIKDEEDE